MIRGTWPITNAIATPELVRRRTRANTIVLRWQSRPSTL
jgi:hypothetical protein